MAGITTYPVIAASNRAGGAEGGGLYVSYAYLAIGLTSLGLCLLFYGATETLAHWTTDGRLGGRSSIPAIVATIFAQRQYARLLVASSIIYGLFYAFASGMIVFQPALNFSEVYHVATPSIVVATCCGPIGETPEAAVYLTQHLGLVLVPINLVLLFALSWLVGLNASFAAFSLKFRTKNLGLGWFGRIGAFIGLFGSCPTCAGLAIITMLGGTGSLSSAFFLGPLQAAFVGLSIPLLVAVPIISARSLRNLDGRACAKP
jgi:hypothetical protein